MISRMRSNQVFSRMSAEESLRFLTRLKEEAPLVAKLALGAASEAFKLRPEFLKKQPKKRQADWMRRALGRSVAAPLAEEVLAAYFLEYRLELLTEWLDAIGLEHEEGQLQSPEPQCPEAAILDRAVAEFRAGEEPRPRELLLRAFAAQSAIDWPELERAIGIGSD